MEKFDENDINYQQANRQVERLRGFYGHLFSYVAVNLLFAYFNYINLKPNESYFQLKNFFTSIFWGVGVLAHALFVFLPRFDFAKKWEEKKIKELMDKNK